jgi:serine/threonine-protein kinase
MEQAPTHEPGDQFGPFTLERLLGRGAAAEVWQVVEMGDLGFQKRQALKLLQPPPGEMETQKIALINEARVCGMLKHPGVVDVYKVGEQDGELYIAMEFVDGPDLNTLLVALRKRKIEIPIKAALEAAVDLADALDYAHTAEDDEGVMLNIVHRDLKPSNVLVDRRGILKISDWGLVKSTLNIESTTRGIVKGTPGYIAPEVWGGTRDFKPAADLFAVGAMLYEFVVGERLFQGRNLARIAEQVARRKPEDEAARVMGRCPELVPILTRLLQRAPAHRYQTGAEVVDELRPMAEAASGLGLKAFIRSMSSLMEEIAPQRTSQRIPARAVVDVDVAAAAAAAAVSDSTSPPATPGRPGPSVPPRKKGIEPDLTATDEHPAIKPHQLGPQTEPEEIDALGAPASEVELDPDSMAVPASFITGSGRVKGAVRDEVPATRAMPVSTRVPAAARGGSTPSSAPPAAVDPTPSAASAPAAASSTPAPMKTRDEPSQRGDTSQSRKRRRRKRPPPPPKKMPPPALAFAVAAFGFMILVLGVVALVTVGRIGLPF